MKTSLAKIAFAFVTLATFIHSAAADENGWTTDYKKALAQAKAEKKFVLIDFAGSTWCTGCIKLEREVFSTKKFQQYAAKKFVLILVDFPDPVSEPKTGAELIPKYLPPDRIELPTVVVLTPDGKKIGEASYEPGGPEVFIAAIQKIVKK
jgi:thiol:disulfide interchange protein